MDSFARLLFSLFCQILYFVLILQIIGVDPYGSVLAEPSELNETDVTLYQVKFITIDLSGNYVSTKTVFNLGPP